MERLDKQSGLAAQNNKGHCILTANLYVLMFAHAISTTIMGPLIPSYIQEFGISLSQSGLIAGLQGLGGVLALVAGIFFAEKIKKSLIIKITFLLYCAAVLIIALFKSYFALLALFFVIGASTKLLDGSLNAYTADLNPGNRRKSINLLHAFFGAGALAGPIFSSALLGLGLEINTIFLFLAIFCFVCFLSYLLVQDKGVKEHHSHNPAASLNISTFFKKKEIIVFAMICLLYTGFSTGVSTWMPTLMTVKFGRAIQLSSLPVSLLWGGIIISRLFYSAISKKANIKKLLVFSCLICTTLWFTAFLLDSIVMIDIACGISGLCTGAVIPLCVARACNRYPKNSGTVTFIIFLYVTIGYMLIPWLQGVLGDAVSVWFSMLVAGAILLAISILSIFISSDKTIEASN